MDDAVLSSRTLYRGWFDLLMLRLRLGGRELDRALVRHPSGVAVLAYDPARRVAMTVRESRAGPMLLDVAPFAEAIAGVSEEGEDSAETARREALEEAGLALGELEHVGQVWMTPASSTERVHLFLAPYRADDRVSRGGGLAEENERIDVREEPLNQLWRAFADGELCDAKAAMLLQALRIRSPALFEGGGFPKPL
jgi:nudix-type nucleoside diphosphatase (YffH/AdpP family)